jgi:hypothetical protein
MTGASCLYGDLASRTTIVLFGDSHAAFWFPAVEGVARREGWRLLNLTMSSCTPADLVVYNSIFRRIYRECTTWRRQAIRRLIAVHPALVIVSGTHGIAPVDASGHLLPGPAIAPAWEAAMIRTIGRIQPPTRRVILLADTPTSDVDPPACAAAHPRSILACSTPPAKAFDPAWLAAEESVVAATGVGFIDPTTWICPSAPCPPVIGRFLVYQNAGHLTATFAATLAGRLDAAIHAERSTGSQ